MILPKKAVPKIVLHLTVEEAHMVHDALAARIITLRKRDTDPDDSVIVKMRREILGNYLQLIKQVKQKLKR